MRELREGLHRMIRLVDGKGKIIFTCSYFDSISRVVWITLVALLNVPMSLTVINYVSPFDTEVWLTNTLMQLGSVQPFDYERANGSEMLVEMKNRLNNAMRDANLSIDKDDRALACLASVVECENRMKSKRFGGAYALHLITPR